MEQNVIKGGGASELSTDLNVITAEINAYQRVAGEAIFEIGKRLKYVKEKDLAHGEWEKWCKESIGMTRQHADKFIKVAETFDMSTCHFKQSLDALYHIATLPPEQRDQPHTVPSTGETKTVDEMTVRELREVKKALKEAEARAQQAEQREQMAKRDADILRDTLESIEDKEPEVRTEYVEVTDELTEHKLKRYEELFGDISIYEGKTTRVTNGDAITYAVFEFSEDVRKFIGKYGHLTHFAREFNEMIDEGREEYEKSISEMMRFLNVLNRNINEKETVIINL